MKVEKLNNGWLFYIKAFILLLFRPQSFVILSDDYNSLLNTSSSDISFNQHPGLVVRSALFKSFILVIVSSISGAILGRLCFKVLGDASSFIISTLQVVGSMVLLWATLAIRGWEIQTHAGITLAEKINQGIYRTLYCIGTALLVLSLAWPSAPN